MLHCIAVDEACWKGVIIACFDGCKPGGRNWVTGRGMVETNKSADTAKVVHAGGLGG